MRKVLYRLNKRIQMFNNDGVIQIKEPLDRFFDEMIDTFEWDIRHGMLERLIPPYRYDKNQLLFEVSSKLQSFVCGNNYHGTKIVFKDGMPDSEDMATITLNYLNPDYIQPMVPFDISALKWHLNTMYGVPKSSRLPSSDYFEIPARAVYGYFKIKEVIFNKPATIVIWNNGDKTVVKAQGKEKFDPEKGLAMAISKRVLGTNKSNSNYYDIFKKWLP